MKKKESTRTSEALWYDDTSRWCCRVKANGKRKAFYSSIPGKRGKIEAERKADEWMTGCNISVESKVEQLYAQYIEHYSDEQPQRKNVDEIGRNYIIPAVGTRRMDSVRPNEWRRIVIDASRAGVSGKPLSRKRLKGIAGVIASFVIWINDEYEADLRVPTFTIPEDAEEGETLILQPHDIQVLFTVDTVRMPNGRDELTHYIYLWRWIVASGMRPGEAIGLQWGDIDRASGLLRISRAINIDGNITHGKNRNARRTVMLNEHMRQILADQEAWQRDNRLMTPWVFCEPDGSEGIESYAYKRWIVYRNQHGLTPASLYGMRHTLATLAAEVPETILKKILGHSSAMPTFTVYQNHAYDGEQSAAMSVIDAALNKATGSK